MQMLLIGEDVNNRRYPVIYHDNLEYPIFRTYFGPSGAEWHGIYRNRFCKYGIYGMKKLGLAPWFFLFCDNVSLPEGDTPLIVFDTMVTPEYLQWLKRKAGNRRVILWLWNPVQNERQIEQFRQYAEVWSYSPHDCRQYGLTYNTPFYFDCLIDTMDATGIPSSSKKYYFAGREKGRSDGLLHLCSILRKEGAECQITILPDHKATPYEKILEHVKESAGLIDYYMDPMAGPSMRVMESIYFRKKLVTNNKSLAEYDFYDVQNIYIPGVSELSLREFLYIPYNQLPREIMEKYRMSAWLLRFMDEQTGC